MEDFFLGTSGNGRVTVLDPEPPVDDAPFEKKRRGRRKKTPRPDDRLPRAEDVVEELRAAIGKGLEAYLRIGDQLVATKKRVGHGEFLRLFDDHPNPVAKPLSISHHRARRYMAAARNDRVRAHLEKLPTDLDAVLLLARLPADLFDVWIANGVIHERLTRKQARRLLGDLVPSQSSSAASTRKVTPRAATTPPDRLDTSRPLRLTYRDPVITKKVRLAFWSLLEEMKTEQERNTMKQELLTLINAM